MAHKCDGLTFKPGEGINFDQPFVSFAGIPVPTYGEYGGSGYTAGQYSTPGAPTDPTLYDTVKPIDPLDALFRVHDIAYDPVLSGTDPLDRAQADVALIEGIQHIPNGHLDADAAIYGGLATLAFVAQVESVAPDLLSNKQDVHYVREALHDIQHGLHELPPAELVPVTYLVDAALNAFSHLPIPGFDLL
jgi:hypothetical protein